MNDDTAPPLSRYIPRLLIDWAIDTPLDQHRRVEGTLVFLDVSGFTRVSERLARSGKVGAEEVTSLLNVHFSRLLELAGQYGGDLLHFGGDSLTLLFTGAEHARRACLAAVEQRRSIRQVGPLQTSIGGVRLAVAIGVHSGEFDCFVVGTRHRELILAGPSVSTTVRTGNAAGAGEILVSAATAALVPSALLGRTEDRGTLLKRTLPPASDARVPEITPRADVDLSEFVPAALRAELGRGVVDGEHRQVTVAFLRFGDVTRMDGAASSATEYLHGLVSEVQMVSDEFDLCFLGTDVDEDSGKIILTAGAPRSGADPERRMLCALRKIADGPHGPELQIGVAGGAVFAGDVGGPARRTYTVIGDPVNIAARIAAKAAAGEILATRELLEQVGGLFEAGEAAPLSLKGKSRPVPTCSVGDLIRTPHAAPRTELPLVGRRRELDLLRSSLEAAERGHGGLVQITGDPGIGKSRLVEEFRSQLEGVRVLEARSEPYAAGTPYSTFRRLLRLLVGVTDDEVASEAGRRLTDWVAENAPELAPWIPLIAIPLDADVSTTEEVDQLDAAFRKPRLHQVVGDLLDRQLQEPAVLILDDVHWMDEASSELLHHVVENMTQQPWLICATRRHATTGFIADPMVPATMLTLAPLRDADSAELAELATEQAPVAAHELRQLVSRSGGVPLHLLQLVDAAQDGGGVQTLPADLEVLVSSRIDELDPGDRRILRDASVLGMRFRFDTLVEVVGHEASEVTEPATWDRLSKLVERVEPGWLQFRNALLHDAAYEGLSYRRRREIHRRAGEALEAGGGVEDRADMLSLHFDRAQVYDKAWGYSVMAGERARARFANREAAEFYGRAIDAAHHLGFVSNDELIRIHEALGDVHVLAALYPDASAAYTQTRRLAVGDPIAEARLLRKEGELREFVGEYSQALRWYSRALRRLREADLGATGAAEEVEASLAYGGVRLRQGRHRECVRWAEQALGGARRLDDRRALGHAYFLLDAALTNLGDDRALEYRDLALPIFLEVGDLIMQGRALNNLGFDAAFAEWRWDRALSFFERSMEAFERAGDIVAVATVKENTAEIFLNQGRLDEAESLLRDSLRICQAANNRLGVALATSNLGRLAANRSHYARADELFSAAREGYGELAAAEGMVLQNDALEAERHLQAGDWARARELAESVLGRSGDGDSFPAAQATLRRIMGDSLLRAGRSDEAHEFLVESLARARGAGQHYETGLTLSVMSRLAVARSDPSAADHAAESRAILERLGVVEAHGVHSSGGVSSR